MMALAIIWVRCHPVPGAIAAIGCRCLRDSLTPHLDTDLVAQLIARQTLEPVLASSEDPSMPESRPKPFAAGVRWSPMTLLIG
jgi:hypothetical protein